MVDFAVKAGDKVEAGESVAIIEGQASVQDALSPISGEVVQVNEEVDNDASLIDDGDEGWLVRIKASDSAEIAKLMSEDEYKKFCGS